MNQYKQFTLEELSRYNGQNGRPSYVAVNGFVYNLSLAVSWKGGMHYGLSAGMDQTQYFSQCHGNASLLKRIPVVGVLKA